MAGISRVMVVGWLTFILGALAIPQLAAIVPESALPYIACAAGLLTIIIRWLSGGFGLNPLSAVGVLTLFSGIAGVPELLALIPPNAMPYVTMIAAACTLVARYQAGRSLSDQAALPVGLLMESKERMPA
jgi:hypothetical protein